jgi:hypothetical protein
MRGSKVLSLPETGRVVPEGRGVGIPRDPIRPGWRRGTFPYEGKESDRAAALRA